MRTDLGSFIAERAAWRQEHSWAPKVRTLEVRILTDGGLVTLRGRFVRITYQAGALERHVVVRARQLCCIPWKSHVYIVPGSAEVEERGTELVFDKGQTTSLLRIVVGRYPGDSTATTHVVKDGAGSRINIYPRAR